VSKKEKFDFAYWDKEIRLAISYRDSMTHYHKWETFEQLYRNKGKKGQLLVNLIYAMARIVVPSVYGTNPYINVTPLLNTYSPFSRLLETVDNFLLLLNESEANNRTIALDTYLYGVGINEVGFLPTLEDDQDRLATAMKGANKGIFDTDYDVTKSPGMPWEDRVKPKDFLVPYGTKNLKKARWCARLVTKFAKDVELDPRNKKSEISPTSMPVGTSWSDVYGSAGEAALQYLSFWEIHCARTKKIYYMPAYDEHTQIPSSNDFLRAAEIDRAQLRGLPFESCDFNEDPDFFWATPDAAIIEPFAVEMTENATQSREHRRKALLKVIVLLEALTDDSKEKLKDSNPDAAQILYAQGVPNVNDIVAQLVPHIPSEVLVMWDEHVLRTMRTVFGANRNTMGEMGGGRRTAREVSIAFAQQGIRFDDKRRSVARMISGVFDQKNRLISKYWKAEQVLPVLGYDGLVYWVQFNPTELEGQFMVRVDPESMTPITKKMERQELQELLAMMAQFAGKGIPIDISPILQELVHRTSWFSAMQLLPQANANQQVVPLKTFKEAQDKTLNTNQNRVGAFQGGGISGRS